MSKWGVFLLSEEYCQNRLIEVENFQNQVKNEGATLFQKVLNDEWFSILKNGAQKVWGGTGREPFNCKYFPFRWFYEQNEWETINKGMKKLEQFITKKDYLSKKVENLISDDWMIASAAALELSALVRFNEDNVLVEIDPKIRQNAGSRADALINIDGREILVELTTITKEIVERSTGIEDFEVFTISSDKPVYQVVSKIKGKAEKQLSIAEKPVVLIVSLPQGMGADQFDAKWAVEENIHLYPKLSSIIISDSYRFRYGAWYFNNKAEFKLNENEKRYIRTLLKLNTTLAED